MQDSSHDQGSMPVPDDSDTQNVEQVEAGSSQKRSPTDNVTLIDTPRERVRHPGDLLALIITIAGIAFDIVLAIYAHSTTAGVSRDVRSFGSALRQFSALPRSLLDTLAPMMLPALV